MFAAGQKAEIIAQLTDAASAPIGHDQITASFSSNGFFAQLHLQQLRGGTNHT